MRNASLLLFVVALGLVVATGSADAVPAHNDPHLRAAPPRPSVGDANDKARRLFDAIVHDTPESVLDFFLPREAFAQIKAMEDPNRRYEQLVRAYVADVHALHRSIPNVARATFERFELARRGGWVVVGEEANRLPYYASRHSRLHYRVDGRPSSFEVRVLITWNDRWYVTHLSEFHH